jgi:hypothetical protein
MRTGENDWGMFIVCDMSHRRQWYKSRFFGKTCWFPRSTMTVLVGTVHDVVLRGDANETIKYEGNKRFQSFLEQFQAELGSKRRKKRRNKSSTEPRLHLA